MPRKLIDIAVMRGNVEIQLVVFLHQVEVIKVLVFSGSFAVGFCCRTWYRCGIDERDRPAGLAVTSGSAVGRLEGRRLHEEF